MSFHTGDTGTQFTVTWLDGPEVLDISQAVLRQISFKKPSNGALIGPKTLTVPNGGTDGVSVYIVETGLLDTVGVWQWQAYIEFADGRWHADSGKFTVYQNLA